MKLAALTSALAFALLAHGGATVLSARNGGLGANATVVTNVFGAVDETVTNGLLSVSDSLLMEDSSPSRHSAYSSYGGSDPVVFFSLNPVSVDLVTHGSQSLAATLAGWPESKGVFLKATVPSSYSVGQDLRLLGYSSWPTACSFQAYCWRCGSVVYVNIISILED